MFKSTKKLWQKILPSVVALAVVVVFFALFIVNNNKRVALQNGSYISDATQKTGERISGELSSAAATLGTISKLCRIEGNEYPQNLMGIQSPFDRIDYIFVQEGIAENGNTYYNGILYGFSGEGNLQSPDILIPVSSNPKSNGYYQTFALGVGAQSGQAGICSEQGMEGMQVDGLSFYAAVCNEKNELVGVLVGRYGGNKLRDILQTTFMGEYSGVYLIDGSGVLVGGTDSSVGGENLNIYAVLREFLPESDIEQTLTLQQGNYTFDIKGAGGTVNACIMQLSLQCGLGDGWIILQTFPSTFISQLQRLVSLEELQLGLGLFFAMALYIGIIVLMGLQNRKLAKANREMAYVVEGLANLYDRFVYVNLNKNSYQYIANSLPENDMPAQGDYQAFKNYIISTFNDYYDITYLAQKLDIYQIKADMVGSSQLRYEYRTGEGDEWEELSIICLSRTCGEASEVLFARQNISQLKKRELQSQAILKEAFRTVEDANRAKSDFLSSMSHDIRTPMNAVLGFTELIEKSADAPQKVAEYTQKIQAAGQHLLGLVNDILYMSKMESGKVSLNVEKFNMYSLLDGITAAISPQAKQKNQTYNVNCEGNISEVYLGDSLRLGQVLINVLSNAVKYTQAGGRIDFTVRSEACGNIHNLQFIIKDNGMGMSQQFVSRIYQPFEREQNPITGKIQGTGLGMTITKNLVDLMGGTISVDSKIGGGTTVTISLNLTAERQTDNSMQSSAEGPLKGMTFLVAEDNQLNAEILGEFLSMAGAKFDIAQNGEEAVMLFEQGAGRYNAILMDIQMPKMDGFEATRAIRALSNPTAKTIPIIAMTGSTLPEDVNRALLSGMNAHIAKPVSLEILTDTVIRVKNKLSETD